MSKTVPIEVLEKVIKPASDAFDAVFDTLPVKRKHEIKAMIDRGETVLVSVSLMPMPSVGVGLLVDGVLIPLAAIELPNMSRARPN